MMGKKRKKRLKQAENAGLGGELIRNAPNLPSKGRLTDLLTKREFAAAKADRLKLSWGTAGYSLDQDIYMSLMPLRARSRDMYQNNEYGRRFIERLKTKCIGANGLFLQVAALRRNGKIDEPDSRRVETHYANWSKKGNFDVTGRLSRATGEQLMLHHICQDGEVLIRIIKGVDTPYGYALQFIDPDRLDVYLNRNLGDGKRIVMGVELNAMNRPDAYWILRSHPHPWLTNVQPDVGNRWDRIPASEIIHDFVQIRSEQTRGVPWMHAAMISLKDIGGYREAAVIASRVGASQMAWIKTPSGEGFVGQSEDADENPTHHVEPGTLGQLSSEEELVEWSPRYPHEQFESFNKAVLKGISVGFGTTYHALSGDLEGVNYSSARAGDRDEHDVLTTTQQIIIDIEDRIYSDWLQYQLDTGRLQGAEPRMFDKLNAAKFRGKRWQEIDPQKTADANEKNLQNGLVSEIQIIGDQYGRDWKDVLQERAMYQEEKQRLGIEDQPRQPAQQTEQQQNDEAA